jgi:nucleotide-binding universal stress UspA family protein
VTTKSQKRVLVPTDFSEEADRAATVAVRFAKFLHASVDLVHVYAMPASGVLSPIPGVVPMPPPPPEVVQEIQQRLGERAAKIRESGVDCLITVVEGNAADEIVAQATKIAGEMIVMGTHGRTGLRRALLGSVAEQVLRKATCPVLVVPPHVRE